MQLTTTRVETQTNFTFDEDVTMGIHDEALTIVLNKLIGQYSNPYVASLREYSSNARDSHFLAGQTKPVEISLPSPVSPALVVEDFGTGLTREELKGFGQFGRSSKRDSNDYIGGFGLGSKSALAVAAEFTVVSVKDGKRNTVSVGRREDGAPRMGFIGPEVDVPGHPNGTKIIVPTSESVKFEDALNKGFFLGWEPGSVLVNGVVPHGGVSVYNSDLFDPMPDGLGWRMKRKITHDQATLNKQSVTAIIGGVRYGLDTHQIEGLNPSMVEGYLSEIVVNIENGAVEIHPSRETLIYDKRTRDYLKKRLSAIREVARAQYQVDIDNADSFREALSLRHKAMLFNLGGGFTYKGREIIFALPNDYPLRQTTVTRTNFITGHRHDLDYVSESMALPLLVIAGRYMPEIFAEQRHSVLVWGAGRVSLTRMPGRSFVATSESRHSEAKNALMWVRKYADDNGLDPTKVSVYFVSHRPSRLPQWFAAAFSTIVKAETYRQEVTQIRRDKARKARDTRDALKAGGVPKTKPAAQSVMVLDFVGHGGIGYNYQEVTSLDPTKTHVLLKKGESDFTDHVRNAILTPAGYKSSPAMSDMVKMLLDTGEYVFILAHKNTNTSNYGAVIPNLTDNVKLVFEDYAKRCVKKSSDLETRAMLDRRELKFSWTTRFPDTMVSQIKNKTTREWIKAMNRGSDDVGESYRALFDRVANRYNFDTTSTVLTASVPSPGDSYPLLNYVNRYTEESREYMVEYINLIDQAAKRV